MRGPTRRGGTRGTSGVVVVVGGGDGGGSREERGSPKRQRLKTGFEIQTQNKYTYNTLPNNNNNDDLMANAPPHVHGVRPTGHRARRGGGTETVSRSCVPRPPRHRRYQPQLLRLTADGATHARDPHRTRLCRTHDANARHPRSPRHLPPHYHQFRRRRRVFASHCDLCVRRVSLLLFIFPFVPRRYCAATQ